MAADLTQGGAKMGGLRSFLVETLGLDQIYFGSALIICVTALMEIVVLIGVAAPLLWGARQGEYAELLEAWPFLAGFLLGAWAGAAVLYALTHWYGVRRHWQPKNGRLMACVLTPLGVGAGWFFWFGFGEVMLLGELMQMVLMAYVGLALPCFLAAIWSSKKARPRPVRAEEVFG